MKLLPEWQRLLRRAWSVRFALAAGAFSAVELALPVFADALPRGLFAALALAATLGGVVARLLAQPELHE